jgi:CUB/sushi domain-containing protein
LVTFFDITFTNVASYVCEEGYGYSTFASECQASGEWEKVDIHCQKVDCGEPEAVENGFVEYFETTYGERAACKCSPGYFAEVDVNSLACTADAVWSHGCPPCIPVPCDPVPVIDNGGYIPTIQPIPFTYQQEIQFSCAPGYMTDDDLVSRCTTDGSWDTPVPVCRRVPCNVPHIPNAYPADKQKEFLFQDEITYQCDIGHVITGSATIRCNELGLVDEKPVCSPRECGTIPDVENAHVLEGGYDMVLHYNQRAYYECCEGYEMKTSDNWAECTAEGSFSIGFNCTRVECPVPALENGLVSTDAAVFEDMISFVCDEGYDLIGSPVSLCLSDRSWSKPAPHCQLVSCGTAAVVENAHVQESNREYTYLEQAVYICDEGYEWNNSSSDRKTCQSDHGFSDDVVVCDPVECDPLPLLLHAQAEIEALTFQSKVRFECEDGYKTLDGASGVDIVCGAETHWSIDPQVITCEPVRCDPLQAVQHSDTVSVGSEGEGDGVNSTNLNLAANPDIFFGSAVGFTCQGGYDLQGPPEISCETDGSWKQSIPQCTPVVCGHAPRIENGYVIEEGSPDCTSQPLQLDMVVVLDSSASMGVLDWLKQMTFVKLFVKEFEIGPDATQIGVFRFNENVDRRRKFY